MKSEELMTLGMRNNNPLNIRKVPGTHWKGELPQSSSPLRGGREGATFCQFTTLEHGIRAAYQILDTYRRKYHAVCIEDIISRWAPPSENNTEAYIRSVCALTGFGGKERLTEVEWPALIKAMALIESRMHLDAAILKTAYNLYQNLKR
ncbi:MAG: structural protein P5 [Bacteroidaceae bacterium]|nr:structural protein P5 [Bacteroidaceae bacterium]